MVNIYDKANELESALRQSEVFKNVEAGFEALEQNPESKALYKEFIETQNVFVQNMQSGVEPTEEFTASLQELQGKLMADENITKLISAQQALQVAIEDLNKTIFKPLEELFTKYEK